MTHFSSQIRRSKLSMMLSNGNRLDNLLRSNSVFLQVRHAAYSVLRRISGPCPQCIFISQPTLSECIRSPNSSRKQGFLVAHSEPFRGQLKVEHKCVVCIVCAPDRQFSTSECTEYSVPYVWLLFFSVLSALGPSRRTELPLLPHAIFSMLDSCKR